MTKCNHCNQEITEGVFLNEDGICSKCLTTYPNLQNENANTEKKTFKHRTTKTPEVERIPRPTPFNAKKNCKTISNQTFWKGITGIIAISATIITGIILIQFLIDHYDIQAWILLLLIYTSIITTYNFFRM